MAKKKLRPAAMIMGLPATTWKFFLEARDELLKVQWPTRQMTTRYTVVVVIASVVVGLVIGGIDYGLSRLIELAI